MRYLIAMIFALATALIVTLWLSSPVANMVVDQFAFDSPDQVSNLHGAVFLGLSLIGMAIGWSIGWAIGGALSSRNKSATPRQ